MAGGITLTKSSNANIPTPDSGKITIYFSLDLNTPAYKDDAGVVHDILGEVGAQGPVGPVVYGTDGEPGDFFLFPGPQGPTGGTGAQGPQGLPGPIILSDDVIGEDSILSISQASPSTPAGAILSASIVITDAQFRSLHTSPIALLSAPGGGFYYNPLFFSIAYNISSGFSTGPTINVRYIGGTASGFSSLAINPDFTGKRIGFEAFQAPYNKSATGIENAGMEILTSADVTGGTSVSGFLFTLWYALQGIT